jgi:putative endonuclease
MPFVYILHCGDGSFYVGSARHLANRLNQHVSGLGGAYTAKRQPVKLVFMEEYSRIDDAYAREKQIQGWSRAKRIALIERRFEDLPKLSVAKSRREKVEPSGEAGLDELDPPGRATGAT